MFLQVESKEERETRATLTPCFALPILVEEKGLSYLNTQTCMLRCGRAGLFTVRGQYGYQLRFKRSAY